MNGALPAVSTADLNDAYPDRVRQVIGPFRSFGARVAFAGRVRTAVTLEDTLLIQKSLFSTPGHGQVVVLDGGGSMRSALLGDVNAGLLLANGWGGIVINGAVRDMERLAGVDLGIMALGTSPVRSGKTGVGAIDVPVVFGNALIRPGDHIYCDQDGILISEDPLTLP